MARTEKFTVDEIIDAIRKGHTPTGAAHVLSCHSDTIRNYARRYKGIRAALIAERKEMIDLAELGLRNAILNKQPWAIAFALRTLGKDEGYTERQEVTGKNGEAITITVVRKGTDKPIESDGILAPVAPETMGN